MKDLFTRTSSLLISAATALDGQWCEKDKDALRELAKSFSDGVNCCPNNSFHIEFVHGKDGEYVRCRQCGTSYGSAVGFLIGARLARDENRKLFYENARLAGRLKCMEELSETSPSP